MSGFRVITDPDECREVWERIIPRELISDLWEVRACFHHHFQRPTLFLVAKKGEDTCCFLPLSWIEESGVYGYFPGETWEGKTWLEQNRILTRDDETLQALLDHCPAPYHLRYLLPQEPVWAEEQIVDEIGYLFSPPCYEYDTENYFGEFSSKSKKRLKRELDSFESLGVRYRFNDTTDFDYIIRLNVSRFGVRSYFSDHRFTEGFRSLMHLLQERGWLRLTTVLIGNEVAAVDMGCVFNGIYTLLAGGTNGDYCGVAKLINIHHMRWACQERLELVDFLCGDFAWKTLFHLSPRPLYLLSNSNTAVQAMVEVGPERETYAE